MNLLFPPAANFSFQPRCQRSVSCPCSKGPLCLAGTSWGGLCRENRSCLWLWAGVGGRGQEQAPAASQHPALLAASSLPSQRGWVGTHCLAGRWERCLCLGMMLEVCCPPRKEPEPSLAWQPLLRALRCFLFLQITISLRCIENERTNILSKLWRESSSLPNQKIPAFLLSM